MSGYIKAQMVVDKEVIEVIQDGRKALAKLQDPSYDALQLKSLSDRHELGAHAEGILGKLLAQRLGAMLEDLVAKDKVIELIVGDDERVIDS